MSERSKRRDLEMAVIDAAVHLASARKQYGESLLYFAGSAVDEVVDAALAYAEYGLANLDRPRAGLRAPQTSHDAAEWAKQFALTDAGAVFRQIYYAWQRAHSFDTWRFGPGETVPEGRTTDEVEEELNRTHQSISARVNALKDAGWIIDSGQRRKTRSGREAIVWTPTQAARDFVNEYGMPIPVSPGG